MQETVITVQGRFSDWYKPERATVDLGVSFEGSDRQPVFEHATRAADIVRSTITSLHDAQAGPVTWWSSDTLAVWSTKPWNNEGKQLAPVVHAAINFSVRFSDFEALARLIEVVAGIDGVSVGNITWSLTAGRETSVTAEVRSRAVKDAVAKASVYAQSIGLGSVRAIALADPGMLGDQGGGPIPFAAAGMRMGSAGGTELVLKPEDIEVTAVVDARFIAS